MPNSKAKFEGRAGVAKLFVDQQDRLQRYLRARLSSADDAAELAQEAYLRLLRVQRKDLIRHPRAYLFRIARNLIHELYTGRRLAADEDAEPDLLIADEPSPEELANLAARREMVRRAVRELPEKCQAALALHLQEGLTHAEIGERMNLSRQMVQKYLAQGLAHCRKRLRYVAAEERGVR